MVIVSKDWVDKHVRSIEEPKSKKNMKKFVSTTIKVRHGGFETELTGADKYDISKGLRHMCFHILIPGYGWCGATTYGWYTKHKKFIPRLEQKSMEHIDHSRDWDDKGYWNRGSWGA